MKSFQEKYQLPPVQLQRRQLGLLLIVAVCGLLWASRQSWDWGMIPASILVLLSIYACITDLKWQLLSDRVQWGGTVCTVSLLFLLKNQTWPEKASMVVINSAAVAFLLLLGMAYERFRKKVSMGLGDLKLLLWLPIATHTQVFYILIAAACLHFFALVLLSSRSDRFAFAPSLFIAAYLLAL